MALVMTSGPALEPVTVAEAKAHLRLEQSNEDVLLASLILTSRLHIEAALALALITQGWRLILVAWPSAQSLDLPLHPVSAISEIRVRGPDGTPSIIPPESYVLDRSTIVSRLAPTGSWLPPGQRARAIEIDFEAGYGPTSVSVPQPIRHAVLLLVAHWYEHRDPIEIGSPATAVPASVSELLKPYRRVRL